MGWMLYDYLDNQGTNVFLSWSQSLEKRLLAKLNVRLDMLSAHGPSLFPNILSDTDKAHVKKLRIRGRVQLRPLLCRGPINIDSEFTLLLGAIERNDKLSPENATKIADQRRVEVRKTPTRRCPHERAAPK